MSLMIGAGFSRLARRLWGMPIWMVRPEVWVLGVVSALLWCCAALPYWPVRVRTAAARQLESPALVKLATWCEARGRWSLLIGLPVVMFLQQTGLLMLASWWFFDGLLRFWRRRPATAQLLWAVGLLVMSVVVNLL